MAEEAKWLTNKKIYNKKYAKNNFKCKNIAFNKNIPEDIILLDWIKVQAEGGNQYIKRLIREDMERRAKEHV